jgi:hypothetical protein
MLHNWILAYGQDEVFPRESTWVPNNTAAPHGLGVPLDDNSAWVSKRVNGLITCGAIGVTLMSRLFFM